MTRRDTLECAHEPFGDAFYYGPERLSERYAQNEAARESSGFSKTTYQDVLDRLERDGSKGKRLFIKDMAYYIMPPDEKTPSLAPSVCQGKVNGHVNGFTNGTNGHKQVNGTTNGSAKGLVEPGNPTVLPLDVLKQHHFTFLIRHPRRGIPSFFRCTVPPLDQVTGFTHFMPNEAGYLELRNFFDFLREKGIVGPHVAGEASGTKEGQVSITVIDADDLLDKPYAVIEAFCRETGIEFKPDMLSWDDPEEQEKVEKAFEKWVGFHNDAIHSTSLSPRSKAHKTVTVESEDEEWTQKYGAEAKKVIRDCVNENIPHYEYLKSFALKF